MSEKAESRRNVERRPMEPRPEGKLGSINDDPGKESKLRNQWEKGM